MIVVCYQLSPRYRDFQRFAHRLLRILDDVADVSRVRRRHTAAALVVTNNERLAIACRKAGKRVYFLASDTDARLSSFLDFMGAPSP